MAIWVVRTGRDGELDGKFLDDSRIYLTWGGYSKDLLNLSTLDAHAASLGSHFKFENELKLRNHAAQHNAFVNKMRPGDLVLSPTKRKSAFAVGEIQGGYQFDPNANDPFYHYRQVKWIVKDLARTAFDKDLLSSLNGATTVFQVSRHNAEDRIRRMVGLNTQPSSNRRATSEHAPEEDADAAAGSEIDIDRQARDMIASHIIARFKGFEMERLVEAILQAQGYTTYRDVNGPDGGKDLLAAPGPLGFGEPKLCVQVKSGDGPVDRPVFDQLIGVMQKYKADHGLLVAWGGFKSSVDREKSREFFRVRLWTAEDLIDAVFTNYEKLSPDIRVEIPLKQIWILTSDDE